MSQPPSSESPERRDRLAHEAPGNSVLRFLEDKVGQAPRINLREEESATVSSPVIDPSSTEKLAVPEGRGHYQLMGEIARGGMGVVLKGHDTDLGRDIAVKVLDKRLAERTDVVQRFVEEAQIGGQLQHPGIVPVYELGLMEDQRPYFTMKLVKGRTLAALLAQREDPTSNRGRLIDIFEAVCQTMAYAHSRGVIHRDLKPANIMVGAFGEVQVVDWGLAKVLARGGTADERRSRDAHATRTILETVRSEGSAEGTQSLVGSVLGTPAYMPPEQASGQVQRLDERSDVFALGAILCEILTGLPPYIGAPDEVISAAAQAELDDAYARLEACETDAALVHAAKQCLVAAPAARPADASVLADRVHEYLVSKEERAQAAEVEAAEARVRAEADRRSRRLSQALGAAVVAIVLVGSAGWLWVQNERSAQDRAEVRRLAQVAERDAELSDEVNAALTEAASLGGAERWGEARIAAERALALAQGGGASEDLLVRIDQDITSIDSAIATARESEEVRRQALRLVDDLAQVAQRTAEEGAASLEDEYARTFAAYGIEPDAGTIEVAAAQLGSLGRGAEIALALDAWGDYRRRMGEDAGALRLLEVAHLVDPDPDRAHLREAMAFQDVEELRYLAEEGFDDQPASTWALLATALGRLDGREPAIEVYRLAVDQHANDFQLHFLLGRELAPGVGLERTRAEVAEAEAHLRSAVALRPESVWARHYLAETLQRSRRAELAIEQFEGALEIDADHRISLYRMGEVLLRQNRFEEARAAFERCATPDNAVWMQGWSKSYLGSLAVLRDDRQQARGLMREGWESGANRETTGLRAVLLFPYYMAAARWGDESYLSEARELLDSELFGAPEAYVRLCWIATGIARPQGGDLWDAVGQADGELMLREALELARAGLDHAPEDSDLWGSLGSAHYFLDELEPAVEAFREAIALADQRQPNFELGLALALQALGSRAEAREWFSRAAAWLAGNSDRTISLVEEWYLSEAARALDLE